MVAFRRIAGLFLALLLGLSIVPAFAQDSEDDLSEDPLEDLSQFEGIEYGVSRSWSIDFSAMMEMTPASDDEDPFASMTGIFLIGGVVLEFEDDDNAESAFDLFDEHGEESLSADLEEGATLEKDEVDALGDQALAFVAISEDEEFGGTYRYLIIRDGEYLLVSIVAGTTEEDMAVADEFAEAMLDNLDGQSGVGEFSEDGTSSDGLWDVFPSGDEDMFEGLVPVGDEIIYPEPEGEDEES